jgi:ERF superfamily
MQSEKTDLIDAALVSFHELVEPVRTNAEGQVGPRSYKYADLAAVWGTIRAPLSSLGLAVIQTFEPVAPVEFSHEMMGRGAEVFTVRSQSLAHLHTRLIHQSGQWYESVLPVVAEWSDPQRFGKVVTYLRRYAVLAILSLACEDDDAAGAIRRERTDRRSIPRRNGFNGRPEPARSNGSNGSHESYEDAASVAAAEPEPAPASSTKRPPPRTGQELAEYCRTCRIDPDLARWLEAEFPRYPHRKENWTEFQVMTARPIIRTHLEELRDKRNGVAS